MVKAADVTPGTTKKKTGLASAPSLNHPQDNQQTDQPTPAQEPQSSQPAEKPTSYEFTNELDYLEALANNMINGKHEQVMFAGSSGLGKTSFIEQAAAIFGCKLVTIEVPHINETYVIEIPYVIFDPITDGEEDGIVGVPNKHIEKSKAQKQQKTRIVYAASYLVKAISAQPMSDAEYTAQIAKKSPITQALQKQFVQEFPEEFAAIRKRFSTIIFLDEYLRKVRVSVRSVINDLCNNKRLGSTDLPNSAYIVYASNVTDSGIERGGSTNLAYAQLVHFQAPTVNNWLEYTISNALNYKVNIHPDVKKSFATILKQEHMAWEDAEKGLRMSPRRWSDAIVYVNANYPFKNITEYSYVAKQLIRNTEPDDGEDKPFIDPENTKDKNKKTDSTAEIKKVILEVLSDLAKKSGLGNKTDKIVQPEKVSDEDWRYVAKQAVATALEVGGAKKYVPVLRGKPGLGKTSFALECQRDFGLIPIFISVSGLSEEQITGLTLPQQKKDEKGFTTDISTEFSNPPLAQFIEGEIQKRTAIFKEMIDTYENARDQLGAQEIAAVPQKYANEDNIFEAWKNKQKFHYLIVFDEINKVNSEDTFNVLRRLILEKKFSDNKSLPPDVLCIGTMNPTQYQGTNKLTKHFRDSIDIIDTAPNWKQDLNYWKTVVRNDLLSKGNSPEAVTDSLNLVEKFSKNYSVKNNNYELYFGSSSGESVYNQKIQGYDFNSRMYESLIRTLAGSFNSAYKNIKRNNLKKDAAQDVLRTKISSSLISKVQSLYLQETGGQLPPGTADELERFVDHNVVIKQVADVYDLTAILDSVTDSSGILNLAKLTDSTEDAYAELHTYFENYEPKKYSKEFNRYLDKTFGKQTLNEKLTVTELIKRLNSVVRVYFVLLHVIDDVSNEDKGLGLERVIEETKEIFNGWAVEWLGDSDTAAWFTEHEKAGEALSASLNAMYDITDKFTKSAGDKGLPIRDLSYINQIDLTDEIRKLPAMSGLPK